MEKTIMIDETKLIDAILESLPQPRRFTARGWHVFNCPACGDTRQRGGFLATQTGGFRYRCLNAGCRFEHVTGWEPDNLLMGRPRQFLDLLGMEDVADTADHHCALAPSTSTSSAAMTDGFFDCLGQAAAKAAVEGHYERAKEIFEAAEVVRQEMARGVSLRDALHTIRLQSGRN